MEEQKVPGAMGQEALPELFSAVRELQRAATRSELCRRAVEAGRRCLGLDRIGLILLDEAGLEMVGTWGTDVRGQVVDESNFRAPLPAFISEILKSREYLVVWHDRELTNRDAQVGKGWNAMAILHEGDRVLGWLAVDNLLQHMAMDKVTELKLAFYAQAVSNALICLRPS